MSSGFDSPTPIADGVIFYATTPDSGTVQLYHVESCAVTDEGSVANVPGPAGMIGSTRAAGGFSIALTVRRAKDVAEEMPWQRMRDRDTLFRFEEQIQGGTRSTFPGCRVSNVNTSTGADGSVTADVTIVVPKRNIVSV